jgi:hypothetical protein
MNLPYLRSYRCEYGRWLRARPLRAIDLVDCSHASEPIFEAAFWHVSYGFRPGRGCHDASEHICIRTVFRDSGIILWTAKMHFRVGLFSIMPAYEKAILRKGRM